MPEFPVTPLPPREPPPEELPERHEPPDAPGREPHPELPSIPEVRPPSLHL